MENYLTILNLKFITNDSFRTSALTRKVKTLEFFDDLYKNPSNFRVKWNKLDELQNDLSTDSSPYIKNTEDNFISEEKQILNKTKYSLDTYLKGYINKITSTRFYANDTKEFQSLLKEIPIYTILNEEGEIILVNSTDFSNTNLTANNGIYKYCGNFDPLTEKSTQLGLFFLSKKDAQVYLEDIVKSDIQGTKAFGLSIHCFGLDFAYRVTREYHPNIDFRFVPDLDEIQNLLTSKTMDDSTFLFEDGQQQLRQQKKILNKLPVIHKIINWISPSSFFLEKTQYFKGVPIYIVKVEAISRNLLVQSYYNLGSLFKNFLSCSIIPINKIFGNENTLIFQSSIKEQNFSTTTKTYIFFKKEEAKKFCQIYNRSIDSYRLNRLKFLESFTKKPKILVFNLEDFIETYEDNLLDLSSRKNAIFNIKALQLIPSVQESKNLTEYLNLDKESILQKVQKFVNFKYRRLNGFLQMFLDTN